MPVDLRCLSSSIKSSTSVVDPAPPSTGYRPAMVRQTDLREGPVGPTTFVGRTAERRVLTNALEEVTGRGQGVVLVEGPAGMGKSALLRAFTAEVKNRAAVWTMGGQLIERHLDFGVVERMHGFGDASELAAPLVSADVQRPDPLDIGADLLAQAEAITTLGPLVLVIDDLQWCDEASLAALGFMCRRLEHRPVLIVLARRPGEAATTDPVRMVTDRDITDLRLERFTADDVEALVRGRRGLAIEPAAVERLLAHTNGTPLAVRELVDHLDADELTAQWGPLPAPRDHARSVAARLAECGDDTQQLVKAVAVVGVPVERQQLGRLAPEAITGTALDEAGKRSLLTVQVRHGQWTVDVDHPLTRAAVLDGLSPGERAELHQRAATVTTGSRAMLHRLHAAITGDGQLAEEAIDHGRELLDSGWDLTAVEMLVAAAGVVTDPVRRDVALLLAVDRLLVTGDRVRAEALLERVQRTDGPLGRLVRGRHLILAGRADEAAAVLDEAWQLEAEPELATRIATLVATIHANNGSGGQAVLWCQRALEQARGSNRDRGEALTVLASGWALEGDSEHGLHQVDEWIHRLRLDASAIGDDAHLARGLAQLWSGRFLEAERSFTEVLTVGPRPGPIITRATAAYSLGDLRYRQGRWDEALALAERVVHQMSTSEDDLVKPMAHGIAAFVLAGRGHFGAAATHIEAGEAARGTSNTVSILWLIVGAARLATAQGHPDEVITVLAPLAEFLQSSPINESVQPWRSDLIDAHIDLGQLDHAEAAMADLDGRLEGAGAHVRVVADRVRGRLLDVRGHLDAADALFEEAVLQAHADGSDCAGRFALARLEAEAGLHWRRRGHEARAAKLIRSAAGHFEALGARPFHDRLGLPPAGVPPPSTTSPDPTAALTASERSVAELVVQGLSNKELASTLHLSIKTVETHLTRIYRKADVRSRTELAFRWPMLVDEHTPDSQPKQR
ncbi:MAG: AAA family ATPase [Aquihabitans sp.]